MSDGGRVGVELTQGNPAPISSNLCSAHRRSPLSAIGSPATPSRARVAISISALDEGAARTEAAPNAAAPIRSSLRRPTQLLEHFWWGSAFLIAVPVMALLLVLGPTLLPEFRDPNADRLDLTSAAMSLASVLALINGLKRVAEGGLETMAGLSIVTGVVFGVMFLRRQRKPSDPLIDLRLFRAPAFSASLLTITLALFAAFGAFLFMAQYLPLVLGLSPMEAGLWILPSSFGLIVGSVLAPLMVRWIHHPL